MIYPKIILDVIYSFYDINSHFVCPSKPTIADILNVGWWATAAAWWVPFFWTFSSMAGIIFFFSND